MAADALTKPLERKRFAALRSFIMNEAASQLHSVGASEASKTAGSSAEHNSINEAIRMPNWAGSAENMQEEVGEAEFMSTTKANMTMASGSCEMLGTWARRPEHEGVSEPDCPRHTYPRGSTDPDYPRHA